MEDFQFCFRKQLLFIHKAAAQGKILKGGLLVIKILPLDGDVPMLGVLAVGGQHIVKDGMVLTRQHHPVLLIDFYHTALFLGGK